MQPDPESTATGWRKASGAQRSEVAQEPFASEILVAVDIISVLVQVNNLSTPQVSIQLAEFESTFDVYLKESLQSYGCGHLPKDDGRQQLTIVTKIFHSSVTVPIASDGVSRTYEIGVGDVKIKRHCEFSKGRVESRSHMYVKGAKHEKFMFMAVEPELSERLILVPAVPYLQTPPEY